MHVPDIRLSASRGGSVFDVVELGPHDVVLDLGCGDGRWCVAAALRGCTARGFDLNEDLLRKGHRAAAEAGVSIRWNRSRYYFFPDRSYTDTCQFHRSRQVQAAL